MPLHALPKHGQHQMEGGLVTPKNVHQNTNDGIAAADEIVMDKAMKRAAIRNLDSPGNIKAKGDMTCPSSPSTPARLLPDHPLADGLYEVIAVPESEPLEAPPAEEPQALDQSSDELKAWNEGKV